MLKINKKYDNTHYGDRIGSSYGNTALEPITIQILSEAMDKFTAECFYKHETTENVLRFFIENFDENMYRYFQSLLK